MSTSLSSEHQRWRRWKRWLTHTINSWPKEIFSDRFSARSVLRNHRFSIIVFNVVIHARNKSACLGIRYDFTKNRNYRVAQNPFDKLTICSWIYKPPYGFIFISRIFFTYRLHAEFHLNRMHEINALPHLLIKKTLFPDHFRREKYIF